MHVEKNIADSLIGTLLEIKGKTKDTADVRRDLEDMKLRKKLHLKMVNGKTVMPIGPTTLRTEERKIFCQRLKNTKMPDGYASNISNCVDMSAYKMNGMKSHDLHVMMQNLLPMALRGLLKPPVRQAIIQLCNFYNELCQRELRREKLARLESDVAEIMCKLERHFPPSFFDVMVHLTIHLVREARLGGPVHFRWMYPFERYIIRVYIDLTPTIYYLLINVKFLIGI
jgi:hypothetical protein